MLFKIVSNKSKKMPESKWFRQVDEKHVSSQAHLLCWSPKMDLLAVANVQGEVSISLLIEIEVI